ncbi:unnamed protein product [Lampetra fluviatilis]
MFVIYGAGRLASPPLLHQAAQLETGARCRRHPGVSGDCGIERSQRERERERSEAERVYPKLRTPSLPLLPGSVREQEGPFLQRPGRCEGADPGPLVSSPRRELSKERTPPPPPPPPDISLPKSHRTARRPYHGHGSLLPFPQAVARKEPRL